MEQTPKSMKDTKLAVVDIDAGNEIDSATIYKIKINQL